MKRLESESEGVASPATCVPAGSPQRSRGFQPQGHYPQAHLISLLSVSTLPVHSGIQILAKGTFWKEKSFLKGWWSAGGKREEQVEEPGTKSRITSLAGRNLLTAPWETHPVPWEPRQKGFLSPFV